jgi:hypothetical protein
MAADAKREEIEDRRCKPSWATFSFLSDLRTKKQSGVSFITVVIPCGYSIGRLWDSWR